MKIVAILFGVILFLILIGWIGLRIKPQPFPTLQSEGTMRSPVALPHDLPDPVKRFYHQIYGENVPLIESAVITGRGTMRIRGITFPVRFRFTHEAGQGYRHYIEATFFGVPIMKVNEYYLDGKGRMELPFGVIGGEPKVNQGANLGLWGESMWFSSLFVTDPRVQWQPIDEVTAGLTVPFGQKEQTFIARFDPESGMLQYLESMCYKGAESEGKTLWINEALEWGAVRGYTTMINGEVVWFDEGSPWFVFHIEDILFNVAVQERIRAKTR